MNSHYHEKPSSGSSGEAQAVAFDDQGNTAIVVGETDIYKVKKEKPADLNLVGWCIWLSISLRVWCQLNLLGKHCYHQGYQSFSDDKDPHSCQWWCYLDFQHSASIQEKAVEPESLKLQDDKDSSSHTSDSYEQLEVTSGHASPENPTGGSAPHRPHLLLNVYRLHVPLAGGMILCM